MRPTPVLSSTLPARTRRIRKVAVGCVAVSALVASATAGIVVAGDPASAAATAGTFTIGASPIQLNQATDPELGTITPSADAATNGMFGTQAAWPIVPIHAALSRDGHLITYGTPIGSSTQAGLVYDDWNVSAGLDGGAHTDVAGMTQYDSFCSALTELPDGRLLMVGGNSTNASMIYDPATGMQTAGPNPAEARWYGTSIRLTDGHILLLGGGAYYNTTAYQNPGDDSGVATTPEIGTGTGSWVQLTGATSDYAFGATDNRWWYPRAFNGPAGDVVGFSGSNIWSLSTEGSGALTATGTLPFFPGVSGSAVMYAPGKVLVAGGGERANGDGSTSTDEAATIDFTTATPTVASTGSMAKGRNWLNLTVLPTGEVLANGGTTVSENAGDDNSVKTAEIWDPETGEWRTAATAQRTRTYHSTSLLLPSGAVFTGGGGVPGPEDNFNAELYYPAYLFTQGSDGVTRWASRPAISAISGDAVYGGSVRLTIGDGRTIASASLITSPSVTHSQNTDERRIPLTMTQSGGTVTATLPSSVDTMPVGTYELTVTDSNGVPSTAQMITIRQNKPGQVTVASPDGTVRAAATGDTSDPIAGATAAPSTGPTMTMPTAPAGSEAATGPSNPIGGGSSAPTGGGSSAPTGSVPLTVDSSVGLQSVSVMADRLVRSGTSVLMKQVSSTSSATARAASSWDVRRGLASVKGVSFESVDKPGYYLLAPSKNNGKVTVAKNTGTRAFAGRATFAAVRGVTGQNTSLEVWTHRSWYLRVTANGVIAQTLDRSDAGRAATVFSVRTGYTGARSIPVSAHRAIGISVGGSNSRLVAIGTKTTWRNVTASNSSALRASSTWIIHSGIASNSGVSLESSAKRGWYLVAPASGSGPLRLAKRTSSKAFAARATFVQRTAAAGKGVSLALWRHQGEVLQRSGSSAKVGRLGTSASARAAGTITVRSGLTRSPTW